MTGTQCEELCRRYIAEMFSIPLDRVLSKNIPGAVRPGDTAYDHQIDLWWEMGDARIRVLYIADAKWRSNSKVDKPDVVALEYAREGVGAQKAMMVTNNEFTEGALGIADRHGIALHIVKPAFDTATLPTGSSATDRAAVAAALGATAAASQGRPIYSFDVVHRGMDTAIGGTTPAGDRPAAQPALSGNVAQKVPLPDRMMTGGSNRAIGSSGTVAGGGSPSGGGAFGGGLNRGGGGGPAGGGDRAGGGSSGGGPRGGGGFGGGPRGGGGFRTR